MYVQYVCSAAMLVNMEFVRNKQISFDEGFAKYFLETDFCLRTWKLGGKVRVTRSNLGVHIEGEITSKRNAKQIAYRRDSKIFKEKWIYSGELKLLMDKIGEYFDVEYNLSITEMGRLIAKLRQSEKEGDEMDVKSIRSKLLNYKEFSHGKMNHEY